MSILSSRSSILVAIALFIIISCSSSSNKMLVVDAACASPSSSICSNAQGPNGQGTCPLDWLRTQPLSQVRDIFYECVDTDGTCCNDPCGGFRTVTQCLSLRETTSTTDQPRCIFMPADKTSYSCISKLKLCALNTYDVCSRLAFCEYSNTSNRCNLKQTYSAAEQQDFSLAACPALHGAVVAFLGLMFASLVGAIIFVVIVVVMKQRKADQEEKEAAEQAEAAERAVKAQQEEQADF